MTVMRMDERISAAPGREAKHSGAGARRVPLLAVLALAVFLLLGRVVSLLGFGAKALWPEHPGTDLVRDGKLTVDASNRGAGYFMAASDAGAEQKLKLRVEKDGTTLTYDLNGAGEYETFPLQMGSGSYVVTLYEHVGDKKYAQEGRAVLEVALEREDGAYLYPNQYVDYSQNEAVIEKADLLCDGLDEKAAFAAVKDFMTSEFVYDFVRSITVSAGELPEVEACYEKRMGICQDLSAVMAAMLRSQGIACRLVIGYADTNYHAWTQTKVDGADAFFDPTAALDAIAVPADYTVERCY